MLFSTREKKEMTTGEVILQNRYIRVLLKKSSSQLHVLGSLLFLLIV